MKDKYYENIKEYLINDELYSKVKDYSKERHRVITYFNIGKLLNEAGSKYGENIIGEYSKKLVVEIGKKYNERTLRRMRQLYYFFEKQKWSPVATNLSWSHYTELLTIKNEDELLYYFNICIDRNLSKRELRERIKSKEYERLPKDTRDKLIVKDKLDIKDYIPNPILIKNKNNIEILSEKTLHMLILEDIESFMNELGNGFSFIGSEYKIKIGNSYNYIDILLYNFLYKCFVVIELKVIELKSYYTGQIQNYMNYIDKNVKGIDDNITVGIIICKKNNQYVIDYCSDIRIISREYKLV